MIRSQHVHRVIGREAARTKKGECTTSSKAKPCGAERVLKSLVSSGLATGERLSSRTSDFGCSRCEVYSAWPACLGRPVGCGRPDGHKVGGRGAARLRRLVGYQVKRQSQPTEEITEVGLSMCSHMKIQTVRQATHEAAACSISPGHAVSRPITKGGLRCSRQRLNRGFTLIELLIVIVIIGISAAIAVPLMSSAASMQIRAGGGVVAADLEYAKSMAISRGQLYSVVFDAANEQYQIEDSTGNVIEHPVSKKPYVVDFANDARLDRVEITGVNFGSTNTVKFNYLGSPFDRNNVDLNSAGTVTLQAAGLTRTVTVEPVTGFISVSD